MNPKITEQHRSRPAYIYVRQSTSAQVLHHQARRLGPVAERRGGIEPLGVQPDAPGASLGEQVGFAGCPGHG